MEVDLNRLHWALEVLNLPPFVSINEIHQRYLKLVKKYHSDVNQKDSKIVQINEAYDLLKNYAKNYRFSFDESEFQKQFPKREHANRFKF
ncbi:MAG: molecular chaperone DnaJ [Sulfurospirillum sp.]|nr:MAG: molecular chaperone DnaJ [Sulfurospirillum sp.]